MATLRYATLLLGLVLSLCCGTATFPDPTIDYIEFGTGGGFSGVVTSYRLLRDGALVDQKGKTLVQLPRAEANNLLLRGEALLSYSYEHPDNMYKFVHVVRGDEHARMVWSLADRDIKPEVVSLLEMLEQKLPRERG